MNGHLLLHLYSITQILIKSSNQTLLLMCRQSSAFKIQSLVHTSNTKDGKKKRGDTQNYFCY